jgi:hypothetical protein
MGKDKAATNPLDRMMTPGQVARRKFKSSLPRKIEARELSPLLALGETFTLLDQFRRFVQAESPKRDAAQNIATVLAYTVPNDTKLASVLVVPESGKRIGPFCDKVMALENPTFLGVVFDQADPDADDKYQTVSILVPFSPRPDAAARLRFAELEWACSPQRAQEIMLRHERLKK